MKIKALKNLEMGEVIKGGEGDSVEKKLLYASVTYISKRDRVTITMSRVTQ